MRKTLKLCLVISCLLAISGCWRIGADKLASDRLSYNTVIGDSWKEQMLLNLVKIRYGDTPVFMDVQVMLAQYSLAGQVTIGGGFNGNSIPASPYSWLSNINGNLSYQDRPTISYAPMSSSQFGKKLMAPLPTSVMVGLLQSGDPARIALRMICHSINGFENMLAFKPRQNKLDARFYDLLEIISRLQRGGTLVMNIDDDKTMLRLMPTDDVDQRRSIDEFRQMLALDPAVSEYTVVYGSAPANSHEIAILTRSLLDVMTDLSGYIEVPEEDIKLNTVFPSKPATSVAGRILPSLLRVYGGSSKQRELFVSVPYRGREFWLDNQDIDSKTTFSSLMFLFNVVDSSKDK